MSLVEREGWMARGRCRGLDPNLFQLDAREKADEVKAVCNGGVFRDRTTNVTLTYRGPCPVKAECRDYARRFGCVGVWGGENITKPTEVSVVVRLNDSRPHA